MDGYLKLRNAIVLLAVDDYRRLRFKDHVDLREVPAFVTLPGLERFFKSQWGNLLSGNMGKYILDRLSEEEKYEGNKKFMPPVY